MKQEIIEHIYETYPSFFDSRPAIECQDGWHKIIIALCTSVQDHLYAISMAISASTNNKTRLCVYEPNFKISSIKEKYGAISIYYNGADSYIDGLVHMAETISRTICEECGKPAQVRKLPWVQCLCNEHFMAASLGAPDSFMCDDETDYD